MELDETPSDPPPAEPSRRRWLWGCALLVFLFPCCLCLGWWGGQSFIYRALVAVSSLDVQIDLQATPSDANHLRQARLQLKRRFRKAWIPVRVDTVSTGLRVLLPGAQEEQVVALFRQGRLRLLLEPELEESERASLVSEIQRLKAEGEYGPDHPLEVARELDSEELVLLERSGGIDRGDFEGFYPASNFAGQPALGFTLTPAGAEKMRALTSANYGRKLAIVLDGEVRTRPVIRAEIGERGIVEGGPNGFDPQELELLIRVLDDSLPVELRRLP